MEGASTHPIGTLFLEWGHGFDEPHEIGAVLQFIDERLIVGHKESGKKPNEGGLPATPFKTLRSNL